MKKRISHEAKAVPERKSKPLLMEWGEVLDETLMIFEIGSERC